MIHLSYDWGVVHILNDKSSRVTHVEFLFNPLKELLSVASYLCAVSRWEDVADLFPVVSE